jgi:methanogenic corrinoid protein MtbC1
LFGTADNYHAEIKVVVDEIVRAGIRDKVKIMIGGAPVTDSFCKQVGADYYTPDAATAAEVAVEICSAQ